jgi:CubicO group peptidase (beta-lactamase class C family)
MLSAIVQKVAGQTLLDYLRPRLFEPVGIEHPTWEMSPQGISAGGLGLSIRTEDIAKFDRLHLQKGVWHGKRLLPEAWVEAATSLQTCNGRTRRATATRATANSSGAAGTASTGATARSGRTAS